MRRSINILTDTDWLTIVLYLILVIFGWMNIFSVNYSPDSDNFLSLSNKSTTQLIWIIFSLLLCIIIFLIDSRFFSFIAYPFYGFAMFLLIIVLFMPEINGARSWIILGPVSIQPSEFAKLAAILTLARYLSGYNIKTNKLNNVLKSLAIIFIPPVLIMIQPDFGSTIVFGALFLVLYREGALPGWILLLILLFASLFIGWFKLEFYQLLILLTILSAIAFILINKRFKNLIIGIGIAGSIFLIGYAFIYFKVFIISNTLVFLISIIISGILLIVIGVKRKVKGSVVVILFLFVLIGYVYSIGFAYNNLLKPYHQDRILIMLGEKSDPWGYEYNINQSKIAIGSGGFLGRGYLQGPQTRFKYVPEQETDFIFCTIAEEWGFVGTVIFIAVYITFLLRLVFISERQRSRFSRIFGYGVVSILFFHFAINIAMTLAIFPVIGIPLPFYSYGGSSLLSFSIMIFILLRLDSTRKAYLI